LLFDFGPKNADVSEARTFLDGPLSYARFASSSRKLLQAPPLGLSQEESGKITTYSGRKQLPTLAGLLRLEPLERAALSNWTDPVSGDKATSRANRSMGARYDGGKLIQSIQVKVECVAAARVGCKSLHSFDVTYAKLSAHIPTRDSLRVAWTHAGLGLDEELVTAESNENSSYFPITPSQESTPLKKLKTSPEKCPETPSSAASSARVEDTVVDDSSDSLSEGPSESVFDQDLIEVMENHKHNVWVVPTSGKGKLTRIHTVTEETNNEYIAACGKTIKLSAERYTGWQATMLIPCDFCPTCKSKLPDALLDLLMAE